jgi:hypothetical protein
MYLCIFRGVRLVGKVVLITVPLPWIMLMILTIRGLTLPGSLDGLNFYLDPDWARLYDPSTWRWAFGQMFFSMSLAFGVMITYASFLHRKSDINNNAAIIGLADIGTSFTAGIAIFATLGAMAFATGGAETVDTVVKGGPRLAFVAFPYALGELPYSAWFGLVFFLALLTLGIDSAFSITESVLAALVDKTRWNRDWTLIGMTLVGFLLGLVYCTRGGMAWLGSMDEFINSTWGGIALLGLLECVVVGWAYRLRRLREHANERSDWPLTVLWDLVIRYVAPLLLSVLFAWSLLDTVAGGDFLHTAEDGWNVPRLVGLAIALIVPVAAVVLSLIRSPGADRHAQHVGQPRTGRMIGAAGAVLAAAAAGVVLYAAIETTGLRNHPDPARTISDIWRAGPSKQAMLAAWAGKLAVLAGVLALAATAIGSAVVIYGERRGRRPSGMARMAAGLGVMGLGSAGGVGLGLLMFVRESVEAAAPPPASAPTTPVGDAMGIGGLSGASVLVLSGMIGLLVIGLAVCFYLAIRGAGAGPEEAQPAEDVSET